jgi:hypothetical protein
MLSGNTERLLEEIYADSHVTPSEVRRLREAVDQANAALEEVLGREGTFAALGKSFDVTAQLLQESLLRLKREDFTDTAEAVVAAVIAANIAYLQANLDAFNV